MTKNKLLANISKEQLIKDFKEVGSATKLAKKYKVNPCTVYSAFKIIGYDCIVKPKMDDILTKDVLAEAYKELGSLKAVGRKFDVAGDTIKVYMEQFGLPFAPQVRHTNDENFFTRENESTFYVAGFIAADGCVKTYKTAYEGDRYELSIALAKKDEGMLVVLKNEMKATNNISNTLVKNSKRNAKWNDTWKSEICISSKRYFDDLAKFNIVPRKSKIYTFPEWLINHPLVHHFMRGYNDGDGCFHTQKLVGGRTEVQIYFSLRGTPAFLEVYRTILERECQLEHRDKPIRISSKHGVLEYGGNGVLKSIVQFLYKDATIWLPRKYEIVKGLLNEK